jgi:hypothetical protein
MKHYIPTTMKYVLASTARLISRVVKVKMEDSTADKLSDEQNGCRAG